MSKLEGDPHFNYSDPLVMQRFSDKDLITTLQAQLHSLQKRLGELEIENAKLSSQLSECPCYRIKDRVDHTLGTDVSSILGEEDIKTCCVREQAVSLTRNKNLKKRTSGHKNTSTQNYSKRFVALKIMYFGQRFYGFASEAQMDPTVESEIFKALEKTRLLVGDKQESQYSRCGRTDKGVSSVGQVIALFLRSNLKGSDQNCGDPGKGEIDYVRLLNRVLPNDIRVLGWCPAPMDFHARFTCLSREYKYLFWTKNLDLMVMESAGKKLVGEHDFRNFCRMDAVNVHNYRRNITSFEISPCSERFGDNRLFAMIIKGSAFLWHQVRCLVAVLFMIGQGLESPNVIDALLDIGSTPRKPQYTMASEIPLILQSCEFEDLKFACSSESWKALCVHFENECQSYKLKAAIFHEALLSCSASADGESSFESRMVKKVSHVPLMSRPTEPSYEERRAKLKFKA